jgi:hypothetical protein
MTSPEAQMSVTLREARDLEILNRVADELNLEVEDVLTYQVDPLEVGPASS